MKVENHSNSIVAMQLARNPDLGFATSTIHKLVKSNFYQCMILPDLPSFIYLFPYLDNVGLMFVSDDGFSEEVLCPSCVERFILATEKIGTITQGDEVCAGHLTFPSLFFFSFLHHS